ncbi:unnamed protein product [Jaminaea pallidilutea]
MTILAASGGQCERAEVTRVEPRQEYLGEWRRCHGIQTFASSKERRRTLQVVGRWSSRSLQQASTDMVRKGQRNLDADPLVGQIRSLRLQPDPTTFAKTYRECIARCTRTASSTLRQDIDDLGQWVSTATSLVPQRGQDASPQNFEAIAALSDLLLAAQTQQELTLFLWSKLDGEKAAITKKSELVTHQFLTLLERLQRVQPPTGSSQQVSTSESKAGETKPALTTLASNLLARANTDLYTRTALVIYDALLEVYDARHILAETAGQLYAQLTTNFSARIDVPTRRSRVCMRIIKSKGSESGLVFDRSQPNKSTLFTATPRPYAEQQRQWQQWSDFVVEPIISAMRSHDSYKRASTSVYQLTELFLNAPATLLPLLTGLLRSGNADETLPSILATLRAAKGHALVKVGKQAAQNEVMLGDDVARRATDLRHPYERVCIVVPPELLSACASSTIEELQISALALIVDSRSGTAPFSPSDFDVLQHFLRSSFSTTHPSGRGAIHALFGRLLSRLAANTYVAEREIAKGGGGDIESDEERRQLAKADIEANRTFVKSVVEMVHGALHPGAPYHIVIAALIFLELMLAAGVDPRFERKANAAVGQAFGNFSTTHSLGLSIIDDRLVRSLLGCADSTYDDIQARALRLLYRFPAPLAGIEAPEQVERVLLSKAKRLLLSGRDSETTAAAELVAVYQRVYIRMLGWQPAFNTANKAVAGPRSDNNELTLLGELLAFLDDQVATAERQGLFAAAKANPLHGSLITVQRMLEDADFWQRAGQEPATLRSLYLQAQNLIDRIWVVTRPILCAAAPEGNAHDQGDAGEDDRATDTEVARALAAAEGLSEDDLSVVRKSQIMLSYSWRGMKEAAALLGVLVATPLRYKSSEAGMVWTCPELEAVGGRFTEWMTAIRHRGAFSTVYPAFCNAATALVGCQEWSEVQTLPQRWLDDFIHMIVGREQAISTTRRSAGIGYAVLALVTAISDRNDTSGALGRTIASLSQAADDCLGCADDDQSAIAAHIHCINIIRVLVLDKSLAEAMTHHVDALLSLAMRRFQSPVWSVRNAGLMLFSALSPRAFPARRTNEDDPTSQLPGNRFFQLYPRLYSALREHLETSIRTGLSRPANSSEAEKAGALYAALFLLSRMQAVEHNELDGSGTGGQSIDLAALRDTIAPCLSSTDFKIREITSRAYASLTTAGQAMNVALRLVATCSSDENSRHGTLLTVTRLVRNARSPQEHEVAQLRSNLTKVFPDDGAASSPAVREALQKAYEALSLSEKDGRNAVAASSIASTRQTLWDDGIDFQRRVDAADSLYDSDKTHYPSADSALDDWTRGLSLACSSPCVPLREAMLALLGRLVALDNEQAAGMPLYAQLVSACAKEEQHVESRIAAALSLSAMSERGFLFSEQYESRIDRAMFKLRVAVIDLLQDDDEEVRLIAAGISAGMRRPAAAFANGASDGATANVSGATEDLIEAAKRTLASSNVSTQRAWDWMTAHYGMGKDSLWARWVCRTLLPSNADLDSSMRALDMETTTVLSTDKENGVMLFAVERPNLYRDYEVDVKRAFELLEEHHAEVRAFFQSKLNDIEERIRSITAAAAATAAAAGARSSIAMSLSSGSSSGVEARLVKVRLVLAARLAGSKIPEVDELAKSLDL